MHCRERRRRPPPALVPAAAVHVELPLDARLLRGEVRAHPALRGGAGQQLPERTEAGHEGEGGQLRQIRLVRKDGRERKP